MRSPGLALFIAVTLFAHVVPGLAWEKSAAKQWKEHREAAKEALKKGKHELAIQEFQLALKSADSFDAQDIRHVETLSELADVYVSMRRYSEAESACAEAVGLRRGVAGVNQFEVALRLQLQLSRIYMFQNEPEKAKNLLLETKTFVEGQLGAFHPTVSRVLLQLGTAYRLLKDYSKAEATLKDALKIAESVRTRRYPQNVELQIMAANEAHIAAILNEIGLVYSHQGNLSSAEDYFLKSIRNVESNESKTSAALTSPLLNLTYIYLNKGDDAKAENYLRRTRKIAEKYAEPGHPFLHDVEAAEAALAELRKNRKIAPSNK
jgi:tetratricopeptide (TPR) repeat protein